MKLVLADDHNLVRAGIRALLGSIPGVVVLAEAAEGREALELIERLRPEVALIDIMMPGLNGLEVAARAATVSPHTRIIILSMHAGEMYVAQALRAGVAGYLLKDAADEELGLALKVVARGEVYLSPQISRQIVDRYLRATTSDPDPVSSLTARQREILQLIAEGQSRGEIAKRLELSVRTVEAHRAQLMERLGVHDVPALVKIAIRAGLLSPED